MYDRLVRPALTPADDGKFVVIDLDTEGYEVDDDERAAFDRLAARGPAFQVYTARVGYVAVLVQRLAWKRV